MHVTFGEVAAAGIERECAVGRDQILESQKVVRFFGFEEAVLGNATKNWEVHLTTMFGMVNRYTRAGDIFGRTDPDQLSIILPETNAKEAYGLCQKIYSNESLGDGFIVRAVTYPNDGQNVQSLIRSAKAAVQAARSAPR